MTKFRKHWISTDNIAVFVSVGSWFNVTTGVFYDLIGDVMNSLISNVVPLPLGCLAGNPDPIIFVNYEAS